MELRLLGPVEMVAAGRPIPVGPPQRCGVLAVLATDAGRMVTVESLIDRVWGDQPPPGARRALHAHLTRLRRLFEQAGATESAHVTLVHRSGGYLLRIEAHRVDLHRFVALVGQARAAGDAETRVVLLREALALWQGEPIAGVPGHWAARMRRRWRQQHLDAMLTWAHAELQVGDPRVVIGPLTDLAGEHPLVEPLVAMLMRALYATGNAALAMECYSAMRRRLVDELGVEPAAELRDVHTAILRGDLVWRDTASTQPEHQPTASVAPAQLPMDVSGFTGRSKELHELDALLDAGTGGTSVVVSVVSGTAGVGKTAVAVHWAHQVASRFPDGQLFVDLRGYGPDQPVSAADALAGFLRALGVAGHDIPLDVEERAAVYRTRLAGRRALVVLDNAVSVEQVRLLLPGTASCAVLVTSRDSLVGAVTRLGARRLDVDLLPLSDAVALLRTLQGQRVDTDSETAAMLAEQCARLPLALRLAAELAATRPDTRLATLVGELADELRRLDVLDTMSDPLTAVRVVFSWSYQYLAGDAARLFRLVGLHPGPDLDVYAAAALGDTSLDKARQLLEMLARAHLIHTTGTGRFGMHDLLRAYATNLATTIDSEADNHAAPTRLFDYYLGTATAAMDVLVPTEKHWRPQIPAPTTPTPPLTGRAAARTWLDATRANLVAVCAYTCGHGWPEHTTRLADTMWRYLDVGDHHPDALTIHGHALQAARATGDHVGEGHALAYLGLAHVQQGRNTLAADHLTQALTLLDDTDDRHGTALALTILGLVDRRQSHYDLATQHLQQAVKLFGEIGDPAGQAWALTICGQIFVRQGRFDLATNHLQRALALFADIGDPYGEAFARMFLGGVYQRQGRYNLAANHLQPALDLYRQAADRDGQARTLEYLGDVYRRQGHIDLALNCLQQALTLYRQAGDRHGEAYALANLGDVHSQQGSYQHALDHLKQALTIYHDISEPDGEAYALNSLGDAHRQQGHYPLATTLHQQALTIAREIGDHSNETRALNGLGETANATGEHDQARTQHSTALTLAVQTGDHYEQIRAHNGLAHANHALGHTDEARHHHQQADALHSGAARLP